MDVSDKFQTYDEVRTFSPALAYEIGEKEAIFVRQLEFWIGNSKSGKVVDNKRWVRDTIKEWQEQLPHLSIRTIRRLVKKLTNESILNFRTDLNRNGYDRTRWYTVNFDKINSLFDKSDLTINIGKEYHDDKKRPSRTHQTVQNGHNEPDNLNTTIPKHSSKHSSKRGSSSKHDSQSNKIKNDAEKTIDYLNKYSDKHFRYSKTSLKNIKARIKEGYSSQDIKFVIDSKVKQWKNNPKMNTYLRPQTLFNPSKFESYLKKNNFTHQSRSTNKSKQNISNDYFKNKKQDNQDEVLNELEKREQS